MIASVRGEVLVRRPDHVVIESGGVGYRLAVSAETLKSVPARGKQTTLHAHLVARDDSLSGRLQIRGSGSVFGTFSGRIECDGDLLIGPDAHVEADIHASRVTVAGYVRGNVVAVARLKITSSGRLEGDARDRKSVV